MALPALRDGGPDRRARRRGEAPGLVTAGAQSLALEALAGDFYASSSRASIAGRRNCVKRLLAEWGDAPYPITLEKLRRLGAGLHAGGFRSAATILSQYKVDSERRGEQFGPELTRLNADLVRACRRGQGPPVRAAPLPLERFCELPGGSDPWFLAGRWAPATPSSSAPGECCGR